MGQGEYPITVIPEIDAIALRAELDGATPPRLLDVREDDELAISRLPNILHIPLQNLPSRMKELDREADWVVICRGGTRSAHAVAFMIAQGFGSVRNLVGGMNGYAQKVDRTLPVY